MKTKEEIKEKIDEMSHKAENDLMVKLGHDAEPKGIIKALQWVIEEEYPKPLEELEEEWG